MPTVPTNDLIRLVSSLIEVNDVVSVLTTEAVLDQELGHWVRDIQIYRAPDTGATNPTLILTVRLKGEEKSDINLHAPGQDF